MKGIKKYFVLFLAMSLIMIFTNVKAYSGVVDSTDEIQLPNTLKNGQGEVTISRNFHDYTMYYQLVEIDNVLYKQIVKLKEELLVAEYYNIYEADKLDNNYDNYVSAYNSYKEKYGTTVDDYSEEHINEVISQIIGLWPDYTENWISAEGKNINVDLSEISGTHDYVIWAKVVTDTNTIYDADAYELVGTKTNDNNDPSDDDNDPSDDDNKPSDDNNDPSDDDNKPSDDNNNPSDDDNKPSDDNNNPSDDDNKPSDDNNNSSDDDNKQSNDNNNPSDNNNDNSNNNLSNNNSSNNSGKKDTSGDKTLVPEKTIPYTGTNTNMFIIISIAVASGIAIFTYKKVKNIK